MSGCQLPSFHGEDKDCWIFTSDRKYLNKLPTGYSNSRNSLVFVLSQKMNGRDFKFHHFKNIWVVDAGVAGIHHD